MSKLFSHQKLCAWALLGVVAAALVGPASAVPWYDRFEPATHTANASLAATNGWAASASAVVTNIEDSLSWHDGEQPNTAGSETNVLSVPQGTTVTNTVSGAPINGTVWVDMYIQPNPYDGPTSGREVDGTASALFFVSSNNYLTVHDGPASPTNWVELTGATVTAGSMNRVTLFMDYDKDEYMIWLNNTLLDDDVAFVANQSALTQVALADDVYADNLWINDDFYPDGSTNNANSIALDGDSDGDLMGDAWEVHYFGSVGASAGGTADADSDGSYDVAEYQNQTDPTNGASSAWLAPYYEKFADASAGALTTLRALSTQGGTVQVVGSGGVATMGDDNAMTVAAGGVKLEIDDPTTGNTNVFVQLYVKPELCPAEPSISSGDQITTAICVLEDPAASNLLVYSGSGWTNLAEFPSVPTNTWLGLAVHLDYAQSNFNLYVSTNGNFATHMVRANNSPLPFGNDAAASSFTKLTVTNESTTAGYIDAVAVSATYEDTATDHPNLTIAQRIAGEANPASIPPYNYGTGDDDMGGELGHDLAIALSGNDEIRLFDSSGTFGQFVLKADGTWDEGDFTFMSLADPLEHGIGLDLVRADGYDTLAFYPYSNIVSVATTSVTAKASGDAIYAGKTDISVPPAILCEDLNSSFLADATKNGVGDMLLYWDAERLRLSRFVWSDSAWRTRRGQLAVHTVCPGDKFVYYRRTDSEITWIVAP